MQILKYCGMTCEQDYQFAIASKATHIGIIFAKGSRRYVEPKQVGEWVEKFGKGSKKLVGVFVNEPIEKVWKISLDAAVDVIQLHGQETLEDVQELKQKGAVEVWKAFPHSEQTLKVMQRFGKAVDGFLIDSKVKGQFGGTGETFDWEAIPLYQQLARETRIPCIIAGGIGAENVAQLPLHEIDGIDVSSGIETNGRKDRIKIQQLEREIPYGIPSSR